MTPLAKRRRRGFILLETLVAFAILAVMLAAAYRITGSGASNLARAEAARDVLEALQSEMDATLSGPPLTPGADTAALGPGYQRLRTIRRVRAIGQSGGQIALFRIEVAAYRNGDTAHLHPVLSLSTLRVEREGSGK
ncbi:type II secretion system protein [Breoghania sp.]|uniref:PulJ/GspJ family protein n=1 Tax=Breoghania sp. TaxID=2065378 RepID=UPI002AA7BF47|nr:type II secretion system protein [Breoghania sp.]